MEECYLASCCDILHLHLPLFSFRDSHVLVLIYQTCARCDREHLYGSMCFFPALAQRKYHFLICLFTGSVAIIYLTISSVQVSHIFIEEIQNISMLSLWGNQLYFTLMFSFSGNVMTLKFLSDASVTAGGFQLQYITFNASLFSHNDTHYFHWPMVLYTDVKCSSINTVESL